MEATRKLIDINKIVLKKLNILAALEDTNVKAYIEKLLTNHVKEMENKQFTALNEEEKEDLGLLMLMLKTDLSERVPMEEIHKALE